MLQNFITDTVERLRKKPFPYLVKDEITRGLEEYHTTRDELVRYLFKVKHPVLYGTHNLTMLCLSPWGKRRNMIQIEIDVRIQLEELDKS